MPEKTPSRQRILRESTILQGVGVEGKTSPSSTPRADRAAATLKVHPPQEKPKSSVEVKPVQVAVKGDVGQTAEVKPQFADFPLAPALQNRLKEVGFAYAFPVQAATFPFSLTGKDVIARAFTGFACFCFAFA
jgi:hypothetical protein